MQKENDAQKWLNYMKKNAKQGIPQKFTENSLILCQRDGEKVKQLFVPTYVRCHFTNMIEMDIQNLSGSFMGSMHASFYVGKYQSSASLQEKQQAKQFSQQLKNIITDKLKITFQNDFVLNSGEQFSSNASDSDRFVRYEFKEQTHQSVTRMYIHYFIHRIFKFGLKSDIFFFPLEQNDLDLVTTFNSIKVSKELIIRFNCMDLEIDQKNIQGGQSIHNETLKSIVKDLYMQQHEKGLQEGQLERQFIEQKNNAFFRRVKISFPFNEDSTSFGYYSIVEKEIQINYTRQRHLKKKQGQFSRYQSCKDILFCRKKPVSYREYFPVPSGMLDENEYDTQANQQSHCNAIMRLPLLKASLGTIIQLCIPIFFLSFLTLVEFLYSIPTSADQVRGQKIGSSTLIVATYISFIYAMRSVIPPTPSWSIFEVAVCVLAASSLLPIIQSIYTSNVSNSDNPFQTSGLFIATFIINSVLCLMIIVMLFVIFGFKQSKTSISSLKNVKMEDLLNSLTKKYFFLWSNADCRRKMKAYIKTRSTYFE